MNNNLPIGVFDSGIGGLTVLDKLIEVMPAENYIYIADQGHCPYGTKTNEQIRKCCANIIKYLEKQKVKAIVIACNTASTHLEYLKTITNIPLISVIEPTVEKAKRTTKNKKIGVIATISTINNRKYQSNLEKETIDVFPLACSEFVDLVENTKLDEPIVQEIVSNKLIPLKNTGIDTLIYGCTHFSILEDNIKKELGNINYIASDYPTAFTLQDTLHRLDLLCKVKMKGIVKVYTTGKKEQIINKISWFKNKIDEIKEVEVE